MAVPAAPPAASSAAPKGETYRFGPCRQHASFNMQASAFRMALWLACIYMCNKAAHRRRENARKKDVRLTNIEAAKSVADVIRTSLGPRGMDKMVRSCAHRCQLASATSGCGALCSLPSCPCHLTWTGVSGGWRGNHHQ